MEEGAAAAEGAAATEHAGTHVSRPARPARRRTAAHDGDCAGGEASWGSEAFGRLPLSCLPSVAVCMCVCVCVYVCIYVRACVRAYTRTY